MTFLCLECGHINEDNPEMVCRPCQTPLDKEFYDLLLDYSLRAVRYGYDYRTAYEKQVKEHGEVKIKYSLLDPSNELQWLAAAALSGVAGNLVYDVIKHVAKQIKERLDEKRKVIELEQVDKNTFEIVADEQTLTKFVLYIQKYYKGDDKLQEKVFEGIAEEEIVHAMTEGKSEELMAAINDAEDDESRRKLFLEMFQDGAKEAKRLRGHGPKPEQLNKLFPVIKKKRKATSAPKKGKAKAKARKPKRKKR